MNSILSFLKSLSENNHKEWFELHKNEYLSAKSQMEEFVQLLIGKLAAFDSSIADQQARKCIFRIHRDVRFSKNKDPYKNNMGAFIVPGGKSSGKAGYYLHLEPNACFIAGGIYMPESAKLKKIREEVLYQIEGFKNIIENDHFKAAFGDINGEKLKNPPRGFPADFEDVELLKYKSYTVVHSIGDELVGQEGFADYVLEVFKKMIDFNQFLNKAVE